MAKELQALGFNINFSPVVDVLTNPLNTVIGDRAFSNNPLSVAQHGTAMIHGLQEQGMIACAKHFPGHGDTKQDSHQELPFSSHSFKRLEQIELVPFRAAIKARVKMIMSAHILFEKIDHKYPATLSPKILTELLKKRLGFKGLIISDDIQMKAISSLYHPVEAAFLAIYAGADLILISKDGGTLEDIRKELDLEIKKSAWFKERVERSIFKTFKIRNKIINIPCQARELEEILKAKTHKVVLEDILKRIG
jgi:beta-N-acetylhexosaminidase